MTQQHNPASVAVVGLGPMGAALARTLLDAGLRVTVWNRTAEAAKVLASLGASVARTPAEAINGVDLVLVCLRDHAAVREVLDGVRTVTAVVNFSSATPDQARATAEWARAVGFDNYVTAAIMVPVPLIGDRESLILYSGNEAAYRRHRATLDHVAGAGDFLGTDHGLAPSFDVGMLEVFFAGLTSFVHAAAVMKHSGVAAQRFLPYALSALSIVPASLEGVARDIDTSTYPGDEDRVAMDLAALEHIVEAGRAAGLDTSLAESMRNLGARTVDAGDGDLGWSSVFEHL